MTTVETTEEVEAELHRAAAEVALMSPEPDAAKAEAHFERALAVSRLQQAKSWELRAATSMVRLRGRGKPRQARTARSGLRVGNRAKKKSVFFQADTIRLDSFSARLDTQSVPFCSSRAIAACASLA
jgi:hypothetical protein